MPHSCIYLKNTAVSYLHKPINLCAQAVFFYSLAFIYFRVLLTEYILYDQTVHGNLRGINLLILKGPKKQKQR